MLPLPSKRWQPVLWREASVHQDTHVLVDKALYSVPWRFVGKKVQVRTAGRSAEVYAEDVRIATHRRVPAGQRATKEEHLPAERRDLRHRSRGYWETRASKMGAEVLAYIKEVFDSDDVLYQLRVVQQVVRLLEGYPTERAAAACRRASFYGNYTYGGVKTILRRALDREPLPTAIVETDSTTERPRFVRDVHELLQLPLEITDAPN